MHRSPGTAPLRSFTLGTSLSLLLAAGCGGGPSPRSCATDAECPSGARCQSSACVADAPPVAAVANPGSPEAFALVTLDGTASSDPDADDAPVSFSWAVSAVDAACAPPVVAGTGPLARVRFGCPGRHAVRLVVTDRMGAESAPAVREVVVAAAAASALTLGPDLVTGHRCSGVPLRCAPDAAVAVSASAAPAGAGPVRYRWTALPPLGLALASDRRATFQPGPNAAAPVVSIETDGAAISGDWAISVEAYDDAGVLGAGAVRVSVGNRPPVVTATDPAPVTHAFQAVGSAFFASGAIPVAVSDPDGDPIAARTVTFRHAGDGAGTFEGADAGASLTFQVRVPYAGPADALALIGGAELERAVELLVRDVNGAATLRALPVVIANRAPVEAAVSVDQPVDHGYDQAARSYVATKPMSRWADPDGDPLFQAGPTGDEACGLFSLMGDGTAELGCGHPFTGTPTLAEFAVGHLVRQVVGDPFTSVATQGAYAVHVANRAPAAGNSSSTISVTCPQDRSGELCCRYLGDSCVAFPRSVPSVTYTFTPQVSDADGDPLEIRLEAGTVPSSQVCVPGQCGGVARTIPGVTGCNANPGSETTSFTVTDGVASATGSHTATVVCK